MNRNSVSRKTSSSLAGGLPTALPPILTKLASTMLAALLAVVLGAARIGAAAELVLEEPPRFGVYYDRLEPTFYTGFAPRTFDPKYLHLHLGRGNQLRATVVLSDEALQEYARDLNARRRTYRALVDSRRLVLTQNHALEKFEETLDDEHVERLVAREAKLSAKERVERNLELLEELNPRRVFHIRLPVNKLLGSWAAHVTAQDRTSMTAARRLELVNLMLPTRLFVAELDAASSAQLAALVARCPAAGEAAQLEHIRPAFLALLEKVSRGIYPVRGDALEFSEFTTIYPIGTLNEFANHNGRKIPAYPTPGRRALTTHQRTKTPDHVPTEMSYSYSPWLPYMHVGTRMHNALHTLFWSMTPAETTFLPMKWKDVRNDDGQAHKHLWLLSRGPMSHGCTHVNAGHQAELRQILPTNPEDFSKVDLFHNRAYDYDVFDIDGDMKPEVMGVSYFIAYSLKKGDKPDRLRVRNERHAYYEWLYAGELGYDEDDRGMFAKIHDGRFVDRRAEKGFEHERIALHEAVYEQEKVQFYEAVDIPFAKALRQVGARHPFPVPGAGGAAMLDTGREARRN
ncbi:MAG: hypothetical protein ABR587_00245 [Candidatus Binatia bacterium]